MEDNREPETFKTCLQGVCFSLIVMLLGLGGLAVVCHNLFVQMPAEEQERETWLRVPATLETCFVTSRVSGGRHGTGGRSVSITYSYEVEGKRYVSDDLGRYTENDMQTMKHYSSYTYGEPARSTPEGLCCYVNPAHPNEAKLFLSPRQLPVVVYYLFAIGGLAVAFFGGAGMALYARDMVRLMTRRGSDK